MKETSDIGGTSVSEESNGSGPMRELVLVQSSQEVKVAIVTGILGMGGAELIILNLGRSLRQLGYEVTIVTTSQQGDWSDQIERNGLRSLHISGRAQVHPYRHAWRVGRRLREENFNVVILTKFTHCERFTQAALNMLPDHVIALPWIHSSDEGTWRMALANKAAWNVAVGVGVRVAETAATRGKEKPVLHIPNGLVPPPKELLQGGRAADAQTFRLCYLGRMCRDKGIFLLPDILELCRKKQFNVVLDLIGDGPDRLELMQRLELAGLTDRVVIHGAVPNDQVYKFFSQAHVLLFPTYHEAMPCTPIEAQFCGCVPIVSKLPGVTDTILDDGRTGFLIDLDDINGFVEAISVLINDRARWQAMSKAGPLRVAEYTVDAMGRRFDQLIQACLHGEYPLPHSRRAWLPVNPLAFHWQEVIPRGIHRWGIGKFMRALHGRNM